MRRVILAVFSFTSLIFTQGFEPPVPYNITSDYGGRNMPAGYDWHWGIDYGSPMWTPVEAVEGGNIVVISHFGVGGWGIGVDGDSAYWFYFHLFDDRANPISPDNRYEARMATLVDPNNPLEIRNQYVFIFWANRNNNMAERVLTQYTREVQSWWVRARPGDPGYDPNNPYIFDERGSPHRILTRGSVANREIIGPSGNSGGVPAHLHIGCASYPNPYERREYDINPLYYIIHQRPNYTLSIHLPPPNGVLYHRPNVPEHSQYDERIRVNVNSVSGKDLDRVFVYLFNPGEPRVFDDAHRYAKITYGGPPPNRPWPSPFPDRITGDGNRGSIVWSGIDPQGNVPGSDDFYFIGGLSEEGFQFKTKINQAGTGDARINSEARFTDGPKDMVIRAHSIRWNFEDYYFDTERQVILDNFRPYVIRVQIGQEEDKYQVHWPTTPVSDYDLGQLIIDKDDDCKVGKALAFLIEFSEEMITLNTQNYKNKNTEFTDIINLGVHKEDNLNNILWLINNQGV